eukprot:CAMPEP_0201983640 /NCGR_PEP_ID=MMETSP0904-20121228/81019_1 /ASSEMBLY_ACC=CAM_ASM_000553 /TAXON_ID=420261 /ORGANISM="Thalassiosira antarctica, Strain CCMP982" /LENGTH=71 /DNA_ID=CAMNT_0048536813 /DNA_START=417 /DNA_END=629 /DNA_ORIENTATION=+
MDFFLTATGYYYVQGGRSNTEHFMVSTILGRSTYVPSTMALLHYFKNVPWRIWLFMWKKHLGDLYDKGKKQ